MTNYDLPVGTRVNIRGKEGVTLNEPRKRGAWYIVKFNDGTTQHVYHGNVGFEMARKRLDNKED